MKHCENRGIGQPAGVAVSHFTLLLAAHRVRRRPLVYNGRGHAYLDQWQS